MEEKKDFENTDKTINMLKSAFAITGDVEIFMQIIALEQEKEKIINKEEIQETSQEENQEESFGL